MFVQVKDAVGYVFSDGFLTSKHVYLLSSRQETYLRHDCDLSVSPSLTHSLTPALFVFLECLSGIRAQ